jgi:hypothetical protein
MATATTELPPATPVAQTMALLQPWIDFVPAQQRRLGLFIFLALLVHLSAFFFIRIDTTRAELQHQVRTHLTAESARTAAEMDDTFWDSLTDPRLFLLPQGSLMQPSAGEPALSLAEIDAPIGPGQLPAAAPAGSYEFIPAAAPSLQEQLEAALRPPRQPFFYDESAPVVASATTWEWGGALAARQPEGAPPLPSPVSDTDLSPTELQVAVNGEGTVEHVLLEQTCQDPELDRTAILAAQKIRFKRVEAPGLTWGRITVFWRTLARPQETAEPAPASF